MTNNALLYVAALVAVLAVVVIALFRPRRPTSRPVATATLRTVVFEGELYISHADLVAALQQGGHKDLALDFLDFERRQTKGQP